MNRFLTLVLLFFAIIPSFAVENSSKPDVLRWVDSKTGEVLWTVNDIVRFDWDNQVFELKREKAMDIMGLNIGQCRGFKVEDADGLIYEGSFFNSFSSRGYNGPTILTDLFPGYALMPPLYRIDPSYPWDDKPHGGIRYAPRLKADLQKAGILAKIDTSAVKPIEVKYITDGWHYIRRGLQLYAVLYPETLRIGKDSRINLRFSVNRPLTQEMDCLRVEMLLMSADGGSLAFQELQRIPVSELHDGWKSFDCKFNQWYNEIMQQKIYGKARLLLLVFTEKQVDGKLVTTGTYHIDGGEVNILPEETTYKPARK